MTETEARLNSHEAVCALRYDQINARLKRLEGIVLKTCGVLVLAMAGVIWANLDAKVTAAANHQPQISNAVPTK